jgi:hypothetical protein
MIQRGSHSIQNGLPEGLQTNADADGAPPLPPRTAIIFTPLPAVSKPQGKTTKKNDLIILQSGAVKIIVRGVFCSSKTSTYLKLVQFLSLKYYFYEE